MCTHNNENCIFYSIIVGHSNESDTDDITPQEPPIPVQQHCNSYVTFRAFVGFMQHFALAKKNSDSCCGGNFALGKDKHVHVSYM